ncbi:MAG TPA: response regulator [Nitrospiraceae bacterium]|nr:response regulator [Nitrospiraceae bacterium]
MAGVLVIGVDKAARLLIKNSLECVGHTVNMAASFAEGSENLSQSGSEVVVTNLHMPESEFLKSLAHFRAEFPRVRILAIASEYETMDFLAVRMMGADDVLRQPLASKTLLDAVDQALRENEKS